ncbi:O-antigen/teichoic acid export membrane protein [Agromyces hippuratus]|uniref:O-antigen/teichoic acid export membrane protein n=2 Tax=Agromyces hippuratus TaxID=286438 RepID=A0A852WQR6_9MICO|nr:hypothetical protein [Agromyces hippuratus]NYG20522.1 O-antigen/teichoic acid export membrane protein [Agromyces hippuratus]
MDEPRRPAERRSRGLILILAATAVAGAFGYLIQLLAPALLDDAESYLAFTVFWSTLYLFSAAVGGTQQEVTRATRRSDVPVHTPTLRTFTLIAAAILAVVAVIVGLALGPVAFAAAPVAMTGAFAIGLIGYLLTAVLSGVLYGLSLWRPIALVMVIDAVLRGVAVGLGLLLNAPPGLLAFLVAAPFALTFGIVWIGFRREVVGNYRLDVPAARLSVNALGTVTAAAATGIMVTGLPMLLRTLMPTFPAESLAGLVLTITLTRAPLIIPLMALQSFLIVDFRDAGKRVRPRLVKYAVLTALVTALLALAAWLWGPWLVELLSSGRYSVEPYVAAAVMVSGGLVAILCLTGPAVLSEGRHAPYIAGWVGAAVVTIAALLLPLDPMTRTIVALLAAPIVGIAIHVFGIKPGGTAADGATPPAEVGRVG